MTCKILKLFLNTLTADDKYSLLNRGNLTQQIQMLLSQKQGNFYELCFAFFKSTSNFENFQKKMTVIAYVFLNIRTRKEVVRYMSKKSCFRGSLDRQHGKRAKTLIQSQWQHL